MGLVELHKNKEALGPLDEAIHVAQSNRKVAYPTIAVTAKIGALGGLGRTQEALALASDAMQRVSQYSLAGHLLSSTKREQVSTRTLVDGPKPLQTTSVPLNTPKNSRTGAGSHKSAALWLLLIFRLEISTMHWRP